MLTCSASSLLRSTAWLGHTIRSSLLLYKTFSSLVTTLRIRTCVSKIHVETKSNTESDISACFRSSSDGSAYILYTGHGNENIHCPRELDLVRTCGDDKHRQVGSTWQIIYRRKTDSFVCNDECPFSHVAYYCGRHVVVTACCLLSFSLAWLLRTKSEGISCSYFTTPT